MDERLAAGRRAEPGLPLIEAGGVMRAALMLVGGELERLRGSWLQLRAHRASRVDGRRATTTIDERHRSP
jgi:hypothetical protein